MKFKEWLYNEEFSTSGETPAPEDIVRKKLIISKFDKFLQPNYNLDMVVKRVIQFLNRYEDSDDSGYEGHGDLGVYLSKFVRDDKRNDTKFLNNLKILGLNIKEAVPKIYRPDPNLNLDIDAAGEPVQSKFSVKSDEPLPDNVRQAWQNFMAIINKVGEKGLSQPTRESNIAREAYKIIRQADWNIRKNGNGGFELYYFIPPEVKKLYDMFMSSGPNKNNPTAIQALQKLRSIGWDLRQTSDGKLKPGKISRDV